jgi:hypothetical protein
MNFQPIKSKLSFQGVTSTRDDFSKKVSDKKSKKSKGIFRFFSKKKRKNGLGVKSTSGKTSGIFSKVKKINVKNIIIFLIAVAAVVLIAPRLFSEEESQIVKNNNTDSIKIKPAQATTDINKTYNFPLKDESGEEVGVLEYEITKAELMDELVVQGQKATAVDGRTFLIIGLKVKNDLNQSLEINTKDYIRLSVNGNKENWLAPDIHNDPVKVQAISTKNTRVGFPINDTDKDLVLRIGEIKGEKEEVPIQF